MTVSIKIQDLEATAHFFLHLAPLVKQVNELKRSTSYLDKLKLEMGEQTQQGETLEQVQHRWKEEFSEVEGEILLFGLRLLNEPGQLNKLGLNKSEYDDLAEVFRLASKNWHPDNICELRNHAGNYCITCRPSQMFYSLYVECKKLAKA